MCKKYTKDMEFQSTFLREERQTGIEIWMGLPDFNPRSYVRNDVYNLEHALIIIDISIHVPT